MQTPQTEMKPKIRSFHSQREQVQVESGKKAVQYGS